MTVRFASIASALLLVVVPPLRGQDAARPLPTTALAGQSVALLPLTLVVTDPALQADTLFAGYAERRAALQRADSTIGAAFSGRAPEVNWVLPPALRKAARRAPGLVTDPDQMGQAVLRSSRLKEVPEPLRAELRNLVALVGGRIALVPAALGFVPGKARGEVRADLSLALADVRSGKVLWRTLASGGGPTPDRALAAALAAVLPADPSGP